jgi:hypothetical protein
MKPNSNEKLTENVSEYESWFFRLYTLKQRRRTQVGPCAAAQAFSQKYWHFRPYSGKKTEVRTPNIPQIFLIELGPLKRISKLRLNGPDLKNQKKKKSNETYLLHFLYKIIVKIYFSWFFNWIFSTAKSLSMFLSKLSKRNFCLGSDAKTVFLGYFNRKTLALWKITSNKSIESQKL